MMWRRLLCRFLKHKRSLTRRIRSNHLDDWTYVFECSRCGDAVTFIALEELWNR